MEEHIIVNLNNYPKFMQEWLNSNISIERTLQNSGIKSGLKLPSLGPITYELRLNYRMTKMDYTWFVMRWS